MSIGPVSTPANVNKLGRRNAGKVPEPILTGEDFYQIPLTRGQVATVGPEDYLNQGKYLWQAYWSNKTGSYYAIRSVKVDGKTTTVLLHREILGLSQSDSSVVDHKSHDTLDNRRGNLRVCSRGQNSYNRRPTSANKSGLKGIRKRPSGNWEARITICGITKSLGLFSSKEDALIARAKAEREFFGEFAYREAA